MTTFADNNIKMMTFTKPSVLSKKWNINDLILLYNNLMRYIESGVRFPFCKLKKKKNIHREIQ